MAGVDAPPGGCIRYIGIAAFMIFFVVMYVWQNVEVMKAKMEYRKGVAVEKQLVRDNDRLRYELEKYRRGERVDEYARMKGMRPVTPDDFDVVSIRKKSK